jgi:hypothetical protein
MVLLVGCQMCMCHQSPVQARDPMVQTLNLVSDFVGDLNPVYRFKFQIMFKREFLFGLDGVHLLGSSALPSSSPSKVFVVGERILLF